MPSRPYLFKFFKGCFPQILLCSFLNTLTHILLFSEMILLMKWNSDLLAVTITCFNSFSNSLPLVVPYFSLTALSFVTNYWSTRCHLLLIVWTCCNSFIMYSTPSLLFYKWSFFRVAANKCRVIQSHFSFTLQYSHFKRCIIFLYTNIKLQVYNWRTLYLT